MQIYDISISSDRREETQHGSYDFPIAVYETQLDKNVLKYVNWHWHDEIQFMYVTHGSVEVFADQETLVLKEEEGLFINSGVLHKICPYEIPDSRFVCLDIHEKLLSGFLGSRIGQTYVTPYLQSEKLAYRILNPGSLIDTLKDIKQLFCGGSKCRELDIQMKLLQCWKEFIQLAPMESQPAASPKDTERLKCMLQLIAKRYGEKLTLNDFADALHLSTAECCRFFKRRMHCTLFEYITDFRIEKSLERIRRSDDSISAIAYDCGFSSTSYYIKRFREKTGMTPLQFRNGTERTVEKFTERTL